MRPIGFSTGALARGDFRRALALLKAHRVRVVELSALRIEELQPLIAALPLLDLNDFTFISIHAPSRFARSEERRVVEMLHAAPVAAYPVIAHPDVIFTPSLWHPFGNRLLIENMDKRKPIGRTVSELREIFASLPDARFCFDIGHARQVDPTMTEAALMLRNFGNLLAEVHISEVNTASRHDPISRNASCAFQKVASLIPPQVPIVLEPLIDNGQSELEAEIARARRALSDESSIAA